MKNTIREGGYFCALNLAMVCVKGNRCIYQKGIEIMADQGKRQEVDANLVIQSYQRKLAESEAQNSLLEAQLQQIQQENEKKEEDK